MGSKTMTVKFSSDDMDVVENYAKIKGASIGSIVRQFVQEGIVVTEERHHSILMDLKRVLAGESAKMVGGNPEQWEKMLKEQQEFVDVLSFRAYEIGKERA